MVTNKIWEFELWRRNGKNRDFLIEILIEIFGFRFWREKRNAMTIEIRKFRFRQRMPGNAMIIKILRFKFCTN